MPVTKHHRYISEENRHETYIVIVGRHTKTKMNIINKMDKNKKVDRGPVHTLIIKKNGQKRPHCEGNF